MFAMKWIADNGSEMIYAGRDISFTPATQSEKKRAMVTFYDENGTHCSIDKGRLFVMNDQGRTISSYDLDDLNKGTLIQFDGQISEAEAERIREEVRAKHTGPS